MKKEQSCLKRACDSIPVISPVLNNLVTPDLKENVLLTCDKDKSPVDALRSGV